MTDLDQLLAGHVRAAAGSVAAPPLALLRRRAARRRAARVGAALMSVAAVAAVLAVAGVVPGGSATDRARVADGAGGDLEFYLPSPGVGALAGIVAEVPGGEQRAVTLRFANASGETREVPTRQGGAWSLELPPGQWTVTAVEGGGVCPGAVTVTAGAWQRNDLVWPCLRPLPRSTVGVLPDGTRYELHLPGGRTLGEVEGIGAVPVWADGREAGRAVGVTRFHRTDMLAPNSAAADRTEILAGQLIVPGGEWAMTVDPYPYSLRRQDDLEMIKARSQHGLLVLDLPASMRLPRPGELPVHTSVDYRDLSVVRGCSDVGRCSPDGKIMVVPAQESTDLSGVKIRTLSG